MPRAKKKRALKKISKDLSLSIKPHHYLRAKKKKKTKKLLKHLTLQNISLFILPCFLINRKKNIQIIFIS